MLTPKLKDTTKMRKAATTGAVAIAACAVCCAPLVAPSVMAAMAAGGAGVVLVQEAWLAVSFAIVVGGYVVFQRRQKARKQSPACPCEADAGCHTGNSCRLPD